MNQRLKESLLNPEDFPQVQMNVGRHTYATGLTIKAFPSFNAHKITIGAFCSFAEGITIIAGGEHFYRRFTTFPINLLITVQELQRRFKDSESPISNDDVRQCEDKNLPWHEGSKGDITIGNDVWIGYGATILSGVTIGDGAVIGARSVVTSDIEPCTIVAGNPAKFIKNRFDPDTQEKWIASQWWSWNDDSVLQAFTEIMTRPALHGEKSDNGDK